MSVGGACVLMAHKCIIVFGKCFAHCLEDDAAGKIVVPHCDKSTSAMKIEGGDCLSMGD